MRTPINALRLIRVAAVVSVLGLATVGTVSANDDAHDAKRDQARCLGVSSSSFESTWYDTELCVGGARLLEKDSDSLRDDGDRDDGDEHSGDDQGDEKN